MKEIILGIAISIQTLRGCIAQEIKLPQYDTQPPTNELLKHARTYSWKAYYREFTNHIFENELDYDTRVEFESDFKKIAKTVTGKTLLYRILIELRKQKNNHKLKIKFGNMGFAQSDDINTMSLNYSTKPIYACTIDLSKKRLFSRHLRLSPDIEDNRHIHLFHELCHWFHSLQDPRRKRKETEFRRGILDHPLSRYYFEGAKPKFGSKIREIQAELSLWDSHGYMAIEELRTILCAPKDEYYQEGDDLCENLYRLEIGAPLRYGHIAYDSYYIQDFQYNSDINVIRKISNTCTQHYLEYK